MKSDLFDILVPLIVFGIVFLVNLLNRKKKNAAAEGETAPQRPPRRKNSVPRFTGFAEPAGVGRAYRMKPKAAAPAPPEAFPTTAETRPMCDCPEVAEFSPAHQDTGELTDAADYAEFMRKHGRAAFVLAEIILPPNSRASQGNNNL